MDIRTISVGALPTNCYILSSGGSLVVIDPGDDGDRIMSELEKAGGDAAAVKAILLTHAHFDHTCAAGHLQEKTGAPVFVGEGDAALLSDPGWMKPLMPDGVKPIIDVRTLREGDSVSFGDASLTVWETPGHSPGSLTFLGAGPDAAHVAFCGDLIFRGGIGRTDLPGGDSSELGRSLSRVMELPDDTVVHPGHGAATTVGRERADNPFL